jgi:hypothetical protein
MQNVVLSISFSTFGSQFLHMRILSLFYHDLNTRYWLRVINSSHTCWMAFSKLWIVDTNTLKRCIWHFGSDRKFKTFSRSWTSSFLVHLRPSLNKCWFAVSDRPAQNAATQKNFSMFRKKKFFFRLSFPESGNPSAMRSNISIYAGWKFSYFCVDVFTNKRKQNAILVRNVFIGCHLHGMYVLLNRAYMYFASYVPFARSRLK